MRLPILVESLIRCPKFILIVILQICVCDIWIRAFWGFSDCLWCIICCVLGCYSFRRFRWFPTCGSFCKSSNSCSCTFCLTGSESGWRCLLGGNEMRLPAFPLLGRRTWADDTKLVFMPFAPDFWPTALLANCSPGCLGRHDALCGEYELWDVKNWSL